MERNFAKRYTFLIGVVASFAAGSHLPAIAQTPDTGTSPYSLPETANIAQPIPGTAITSASALEATPQSASDAAEPVAQRVIQPGRVTRSGPSYVGIGINIGIDGNGTALGEGSFTVFSKIGLTNELSVRPAILIEDNALIMIPVTYDFPRREAIPTQVNIAPYLGGGLGISTGDDGGIGVVGTAGIDIPLSPEFTATAALNVGLLTGNFDVGLLVGGAYNLNF